MLPDTTKTSALILFLMASETVHGRLIAVSRLPYELADFITSLAVPAFVVMVLIMCTHRPRHVHRRDGHDPTHYPHLLPSPVDARVTTLSGSEWSSCMWWLEPHHTSCWDERVRRGRRFGGRWFAD